MKLFSSIINRLKDNRKLEVIVYSLLILVIAVIILITGGISCDRKADEAKTVLDTPVSDTGDSIEAKLEAILSNIEGAGRVMVMITYDSSAEKVPATDVQRSVSEGGSSEISKPVTVTQGGTQSPVILAELMPSIRGVIVVAEGARDIMTRNALEQAVSTVLGTEVSRISVFSMKH